MASPPRRLTLRQSVAFAWRTLRSMRTALVLLLLLALASVAGSLIPQIPNSPERVGQFVRAHEVIGEVYRRVGLFDVYGSWWFVLITALLFTSLVACLLPRSRAHLRAIGQRPVQAREIDAFPLVRGVRVVAPPAEAAAAAASVLRRRRFRVATEGTSVAAEKGALREAGSLVFHWAFVLLLIGAIVGKGTGYSGRAAIVEGQTWTDAALNYDALRLRLGRYFRGDFSGLGLRLVDYRDAFDERGLPLYFESELELLDTSGQLVRTDVASVNDPVGFEDLRIHQFGFGWAPEIRVERGGEVLTDGSVLMSQVTAPEGRSQLAQSWHGFVKLPAVAPNLDMAVELELWPDGRSFFNDGMPMFDAHDPWMRYRVWEGRLLDPSKASLDTQLMEMTREGFFGEGWTVDLERACVLTGPSALALEGGGGCPDGATPSLVMAFPALHHYSVLQVSKDTGVPIVLAAAILIVLGLLSALYTSRRKLWVRVEAADEGSRLLVGGFALQRKEQFQAEFERTVAALVAASGGPLEREAVQAR